jgi:hypothetical protein
MIISHEGSAPPGKQQADQPSYEGCEHHKKSLDDASYVGFCLRHAQEGIGQNDTIHPRTRDEAHDPVGKALDE